MSQIRVRNDTGADLDEVRLTQLAGSPRPLPLGPLRQAATTDWIEVAAVPRYPAVEASGAAGELVHLPYEAERQPSLPAGRYTYVLRIEGGRLVIDLHHDGPTGAGDRSAM